MLAVSAFVVFWLQPAEPITTLQFWLPFATLGIAALSWALTSTPEVRSLRQNWSALAVLGGVAMLADLNRYFGLKAVYTNQTPAPLLVLLILAALGALALMFVRWQRSNRFWLIAAIVIIVAIFVVLKTPALSQQISAFLVVARSTNAQKSTAALSWLGYSYLAFRLMHTIRDRQMGRLPAVTLSEYVNYAIFFPAFTAGPIDRIERFTKDLCAPQRLTNEDWLQAGSRLFVGLFKKFVIADLLAVISINDVLVHQVQSTPWLWVFLYAYTLRIFFDFSGYTDMAIGIGRLMGIRLPENFMSPYLKPNLTQFWNTWHITLTQWFRSYIFNPMTRALRSSKRQLPTWSIILTAQLTTMILIGLWHGITWGFAVWGAWHAIGLFAHNRWTDMVKSRMPKWTQSLVGQKALSVVGVFLTFNYVALGWLFFTLSSPGVAWLAMRRLFGLA